MLYTTVVLALVTIALNGQTYPNFNQSDIDEMRGYFKANIDITQGWQNKQPYTGCVIASPSQTDPLYYYSWQRDSSVSMNVLHYTSTNNSEIETYMNNYIQWVDCTQTASDPNGINVLGEPKFYIDCTVYDQGWCRPQNDGPATRSIAISNYAQYLLSNNQASKVQSMGLYIPGNTSQIIPEMKRKLLQSGSCDVSNPQKIDCGYVGITQQECEEKNCCWEEIDNNPDNYPWCYHPSSNPNGPTGLIPTDANYVAQVWSNAGNNCDLWEEVRGPQFYTYMVQYQSMKHAAALATHYGDTSSATTWSNAATQICEAAQGFDNNGFISEQQRQYDCSVILGPLYGGDEDCFPPTNADVMSTAGQIATEFDGYFQVNKDDDNAGLPGVLLGRYINDGYSGCNSNGGSQGHAWILCSNALGDLYYRNSQYLFEIHESIMNNDISESELDTKVGYKRLEAYALNVKKDFKSISDKLYQFAELWKLNKLSFDEKKEATLIAARVMAGSGDGQMTRVKYHVSACKNHMAEQICENSGEEIGAFDLTWSYGTVLSAWYYRSEALKYGYEPMPFEIEANSNSLFNTKEQPSCQPGCYDAAPSCCSGQCN